jgi:hypothetical protein
MRAEVRRRGPRHFRSGYVDLMQYLDAQKKKRGLKEGTVFEK